MLVQVLWVRQTEITPSYNPTKNPDCRTHALLFLLYPKEKLWIRWLLSIALSHTGLCTTTGSLVSMQVAPALPCFQWPVCTKTILIPLTLHQARQKPAPWVTLWKAGTLGILFFLQWETTSQGRRNHRYYMYHMYDHSTTCRYCNILMGFLEFS